MLTGVSASLGRRTEHLRQGGLNDGIDFSQLRRLGGLDARCLEAATISPRSHRAEKAQEPLMPLP